MRLSIEDLDNSLRIIHLEGRLDLLGHDQIDSDFTEACAEKPALIVLDMSDVNFLATIGIRLLALSARAQEELGGKLVLAAPQPHIRRSIETTGVDELVPIYDSVADAITLMEQLRSS